MYVLTIDTDRFLIVPIFIVIQYGVDVLLQVLPATVQLVRIEHPVGLHGEFRQPPSFPLLPCCFYLFRPFIAANRCLGLVIVVVVVFGGGGNVLGRGKAAHRGIPSPFFPLLMQITSIARFHS